MYSQIWEALLQGLGLGLEMWVQNVSLALGDWNPWSPSVKWVHDTSREVFTPCWSMESAQ